MEEQYLTEEQSTFFYDGICYWCKKELDYICESGEKPVWECKDCDIGFVLASPSEPPQVLPSEDEPLHLIVSSFKDATWIKPSRRVRRRELVGLLMDAVAMCNESSSKYIDPEDCGLRVMLTVDEEQPDLDEEEELDEG